MQIPREVVDIVHKYGLTIRYYQGRYILQRGKRHVEFMMTRKSGVFGRFGTRGAFLPAPNIEALVIIAKG